jgi:5'-3' exonuclease
MFNMKTICLIDADSLQYIGSNCEEVEQAYDKVDSAISNIVATSGASHYMVLIEKPYNNNFRKKIVSSYKVGRKGKPLPNFYNEIKEYIILNWGGYGVSGYETDDVIISLWKKCKEEYPFNEVLIASMDKDLKQYPITFFDTYYRRFGEVTNISDNECDYNFWSQMIQGDSTDSISGVKGKGVKYAESSLKQSKNHFITTCRVYRGVYGSRWQKNFIKNYVQLRLLDNLNVTLDLLEVEFN